MIEILPEEPATHAAAIEALYDATFGPGHFAKTAERLREGNRSLPQLSRVALRGGRLVGVCRLWPITVTPSAGAQRRAVFVGPVAVAPDAQGDRLGLRVTLAALDAATAAGWPAAVLIGAPKYFGEIGFVTAAPGQISMPGPQDPGRIMVRDLAVATEDLSGLCAPDFVLYPAEPLRPQPAGVARAP